MSVHSEIVGGNASSREYERILFGATPEGVVNFGVGAPDEAILKKLRAATLEATQHRLAQNESHFLMQYGPTRGDGEFVEALSQFLTAEYSDTVKTEELMVTSGASQGLQMAATFYFSAGDTVFVEDPTYFLAIQMLKDLHLNIVPIPQDADGMQVDLLEQMLEQGKSSPGSGGTRSNFKAMVYVIPTYNNPTGSTLSAARREKLVQLAYKHQLLVVSDDVYTMLRYDSSSSADLPPRLVSYDKGEGRVLSNNSFTKIFGPGVRLGWYEARSTLLKPFLDGGWANSGGSANHLTSGIMCSCLQLGLQARLLHEVKLTYQSRKRVLCDELRLRLPKGCTFTEAPGGYFVWVELPERCVFFCV